MMTSAWRKQPAYAGEHSQYLYNHPEAARVPTHTVLFSMKKFPVIDCERDSIQEYYPRCME
jgi:hypothetical protein